MAVVKRTNLPLILYRLYTKSTICRDEVARQAQGLWYPLQWIAVVFDMIRGHQSPGMG